MNLKKLFYVVGILFLITNSSCSEANSFKDPRDGKRYRIVHLGNQTWMAENLSYFIPGSSRSYEDDDGNLKEYGYLYDWETACEACPPGWRLPSADDYMALFSFFNEKRQLFFETEGFNAKLGGFLWKDSFYELNRTANYWIGEEKNNEVAYYWGSNVKNLINVCYKTNGSSVRCIKKEKLISKSFQDTSNSHLFIWDFKTPQIFEYSLEQESFVQHSTNKDDPLTKSKAKGSGDLIFDVGTDQLANIRLTNIRVSGEKYGVNGQAIPIDPAVAPEQTHYGLNSNGKFTDAVIDISFSMMFMLPTDTLQIGVRDELPINIPFDLLGHKSNFKGKMLSEYKGSSEIEGSKCAVLKTEIHIDEFEVPDNLIGEFKANVTASIIKYFDYEKKDCVAIDMESLIDLYFHKEKTNTERYSFFMNSKSDNKIKIRINEY